MEERFFSDKFRLHLLEKYSDKYELATIISDLIGIDRALTLRRLRGTVRFKFDEALTIARYFDISLDKIIVDIHSDHTPPVTTTLKQTSEINDIAISSTNRYIADIESILGKEELEFGGSYGVLPMLLFLQYNGLVRYFYFVWGHFCTKSKKYQRLETTHLTQEIYSNLKKLRALLHQLDYTFIIWGEQILPNLVRDIEYIKSAGYITDKEIKVLKSELLMLLDELESYAREGKYPDTGKKFDLYISCMTVNDTHSYLCSSSYYLYRHFIKFIQSFSTYERSEVLQMRKDINDIKAAAILISCSAEREKSVFFNKQREIVGRL